MWSVLTNTTLRGTSGDFEFFASDNFAAAAPATAAPATAAPATVAAPAAAPMGGTTKVGRPTLMEMMAKTAQYHSPAGTLAPATGATAATCSARVMIR